MVLWSDLLLLFRWGTIAGYILLIKESAPFLTMLYYITSHLIGETGKLTLYLSTICLTTTGCAADFEFNHLMMDASGMKHY